MPGATVVAGSASVEDAADSFPEDRWAAVVGAGKVLEVQIPVLADHKTVLEAHTQEAADLRDSCRNQAQPQAVRESHGLHQEH